MNGDGVNDLGSVLSAFSGLIAVFWFYRGLRLQSVQISEQRKQFAQQFEMQYQDSLLIFLNICSDKMKNYHAELLKALGISNESLICSTYVKNLKLYKRIIKSTNPEEVIIDSIEWEKIEEPCIKFMNSVRDIIKLYKQRINLAEENDENDPVIYVFINNAHIMDQPFMSFYKNTVKALSEEMMIFSPGRKSMKLASRSAPALLVPPEIVKIDVIRNEIKIAKKSGVLIPKICEKLLHYFESNG